MLGTLVRRRTDIEVARRDAAWLSLAAVLLGTAIVPALHLGVHALEAHDRDASRPAARPRPIVARGHAPAHGHRHVGLHHHHHGHPDAGRLAAEPPPATPHDHVRHQHRHDGDDGEPTRHGRGSLEHLGVALLPGATAMVPPPPLPSTSPALASAPAGILPAPQARPNAIRGPPPALHRHPDLAA
jgi:hypothetical protein